MLQLKQLLSWFFPGNTTDQPSDPMLPPNDYPHWVINQNGGIGRNNSINQLYDNYLALGLESWNCGSVHNLWPCITVPVFVMMYK